MSDNFKEVRFDKYCETCKHFGTRDAMYLNPNIGVYDGEKWSGAETSDEIIPCAWCLEEGAREGTEVPVEWEAK